MFLKIEEIYQIIQKYFSFLPNSPASKIGLSEIANRKRNEEAKNLIEDEDIKKTFEFYIENHKNIQDNQNIYKILFLLQCLKETRNLEGNIIELGSWKAGNAILMAKFLKQIKSKKKIFACDTFEGIPKNDEFVNNPLGKGLFSDANIEEISNRVKAYGLDDIIYLVKGLFENTLKKLNDEKFSLVFLDCNVYNSAKFAINFAYTRLTPDGIFISHCYGINKDSNSLWGESVAVDEYLSSKPERIVIDSIPFFQKGNNIPKIKNKQPKDKFSNYYKP